MLVNNMAYSCISLNHIQQKTDLLTIALSSDQEETPVDREHGSRLDCVEWFTTSFFPLFFSFF